METWVDVVVPFEKYLILSFVFIHCLRNHLSLVFLSHYFFTFVPSSLFCSFFSNVPCSILLLIWTVYISAQGDTNKEMIYMRVIHMALYIITHNLDVYIQAMG